MQKKLLFVVNVDWFFVSHRLPIALAAKQKGYEVHIACTFTDQVNYLLQLGFILHPVKLSRSGTRMWSELSSFASIFNVLRQVKPDIVHLVTIKPVLYGGLASRLLGIRQRVASISGLGYIFIARDAKASVLRFFVSLMYRLALRSSKTKVIFQNPDDQKLLQEIGAISAAQAVMISGSGVNLELYHVQPEPEGTPVVMLVARLLIDKGVREFVEAARQLKQQGTAVRMVLVGDTDDGNPKSINIVDIQHWVQQCVVEHWGYQKDINSTMAQANIIVLPSYREGLPKCLIEAAACGRAVITTDVPGCRDAIMPNKTGVLVAVRSSGELASAIVRLCVDAGKRRWLGENGRKLAEAEFDINSVIDAHLGIYHDGAQK